MNLKALVGSGDKIALFTAPVVVAGVALNIAYPRAFEVGGPPAALAVISAVALAAGVTVWAWSAVLIVTKVAAVIGVVMYAGTRIFARAEEAELSATFGADWDRYRAAVRVAWL